MARAQLKNGFKITERGCEYLALAAAGYKNFEIAKVLIVDESTVKKFFESIFKELHAKDRTHAAVLALMHQIITFDFIKFMNNRALIFFEENPNFYSERQKIIDIKKQKKILKSTLKRNSIKLRIKKHPLLKK